MVSNDADLARQLGVSPAVVCRLKKRGMPTGSVQAAKAWREANLSPARRRDPDSSQGRLRAGIVQDGRAAAQRVAELVPAAQSAAAAGLFHCVADEVRAALRAVPAAARAGVELPLPVWEALVSPVLEAVREHLPGVRMGGDAAAPTPEGAAAPAAMGDDEAASVGGFWYAVAAREPLPAEFRP